MIVCRCCREKKTKNEYYLSHLKNGDYQCKTCHANYQKNRIRSDKKFQIKNVERACKWYEENKERKRKYDAEYRKRTRDKRRLASKRWRDNHPKRKRADTAKRRAQRIKATPPWVNTEELTKIYENCPDGYHVDHIIPLKGKKVCGLHVPWNLQYLKARDNLKKSNHYSWNE